LSQNKAISDTISITWTGIEKVQIKDDTVLYLTFRDALYDSKYGLVPVYYKKFAFPFSDVSLSAKITNASYKILTDEEKNILVNSYAGSVQDEFFIETRLSSEQKNNYVEVFIIPFRKDINNGTYEKLTKFELNIFFEFELTNKSSKNKRKQFKNNSVLSSGDIYKLCVSTSGIHKITYEDLQGMGINVGTINPKHIRIYGNGKGMLPESNATFRYDDLYENAIYVEGESDGVFNAGDYILFYAISPIEWVYEPGEKRFIHKTHYYSDVNCYFLTTSHGEGKRVTLQNTLTDVPTHTVNTFDDYLHHEKDLVNLIHSGAEWYGEAFDIQTEYSFSFNFPNIVNGSMIRLKTNLAARSFYNSSFNVTANGNPFTVAISAVPTSYTSDYARASQDTLSFNAGSSQVNVTIKYNKPASNSLGWLNFIQINARRHLSFTSPQMLFRDMTSVGTGNISEFTIGNASAALKIWEVSNPFEPKNQQYNLSGSEMKFTLNTDSLKEFIAFDGQGFYSPQFIGKIDNQDLHGLGFFEFIIVTHPSFFQEAQRLALAHYDASGLSSVVVSTEQIYNEFSSGVRDATAIRDFVKMFYDRASNASEMPKYLLLFGDGSYDNKNRIENNTPFIPTYQSSSSLQPTASYVTDDYFGLLDASEGQSADGALDIGIGRYPVKTIDEARNAVNKSILYLTKHNIIDSNPTGQCSGFSGSISNYSDWRNVVCFVADDEDGNLHISQAEFLAGMVDTTDKSFNIDKIYFDAYLQQTSAGGQRYPEVNDALNTRVEKGALIINYTGHGGEEGLAHERVLTVNMINNFKNKYNLPVFVTATCEFSRFDDPKRTSAGELLFLNPSGGAVALFSTTRLAFANTNFSLNKSFYTYALDKINNTYPSLGELMKLSKNNIGNITSVRNFVLLGDPALKMVYPEFDVVTTTVPDTMKAMSKVTVAGYIADHNGDVMTDFNGIIYPTVFDKPSLINTLANDPQSSVFTFKLQKNILFKGKASVVNGYFSFEFIVPKDIAYTYELGKISYYAEDGTRDAKGYFDGFIIGGFDENYTPDDAGPVINLYMNNESFVFGGITDENPILLAILADSSGINTTGNGIGHDITAVLDDNTTRVIILNDYYESELNSYQQGRVIYPFYNLELGLHNLRLKVWDVHNNSSEAYIEFLVTDSEELAIKHLFNYPNPFRDLTTFIFEHNQTCNELTVEIQIFSTDGRLVKTIERSIINSGFKSEPIVWNGTDEGGDRLSEGLYIYKLYVKNCDGLKAEKSQKLILLK